MYAVVVDGKVYVNGLCVGSVDESAYPLNEGVVSLKDEVPTEYVYLIN